ncbi:MAG: pantoate--beta-alanine ligase [Cyclobacteriaceae bacterium]
MNILTSVVELTTYVAAIKKSSSSIGFVPTMGNLHEGHLSLIRTAKQSCDVVIVSIFVNPTQFNKADDLKKYPRTVENDTKLLEVEDCTALFLPSVEDVYPSEPTLRFSFGTLESVLEGAHRTGHFNGVALIVSKLFHWVQPNIAFFGEKDLQQVRIIESMVRDLSFQINIKVCPIQRENNGLAMSSRNNRLSADEKEQASHISVALTKARQSFSTRAITEVKKETISYLEQNRIKVEYVDIVDGYDLRSLEEKSELTYMVVAAYVGDVRLIDNMALN